MTDLATEFAAMLAPGRAPKTRIDDAEYGVFLLRAVRAWERRVIDNPEMLAVNEAILGRMREITAVAIAYNADRYAIDPRSGASMAECARILGIGKPAASERRARGAAIMSDRVKDAGVIRYSEARRERHAVTAAHDAAVIELDAYRARHAAAS